MKRGESGIDGKKGVVRDRVGEKGRGWGIDI